ncbi:unnamed protein product, partial [Allacma fusca]
LQVYCKGVILENIIIVIGNHGSVLSLLMSPNPEGKLVTVIAMNYRLQKLKWIGLTHSLKFFL